MRGDISFVIPAYNCEHTLAEAVDSIYNRNFTKGDEVIIVDDASTDKTLKVARSLQKKYPSIRIYRHHYKKGSAAAGRNTAIDHSKHELIFCLDADNILGPKSVQKLKEYMLSKNADAAAFGELYYFKENIQNVTHIWKYKKNVTLYDAINKTKRAPCASGNYLFTKESWLKAGRYNESVGGANDSWAFGFNQLATGSKMVTMPHSFYYHRYGYQSAYVRDTKTKNISVTILQILLPYLHLFEEKDISYIMSKKERTRWFDNLEKHPVHLKNNSHTKLLINIQNCPIANKMKSYFARK